MGEGGGEGQRVGGGEGEGEGGERNREWEGERERESEWETEKASGRRKGAEKEARHAQGQHQLKTRRSHEVVANVSLQRLIL